MTEIEKIIAEAATLPLKDAAFALWRQRPRLDTLEGRPTSEEVRVNRAMSPEQLSAKLRYDRDHAQDGPTFDRLKPAHPQADDADIKQAIIAAVKFDDDCFKNFSYDGITGTTLCGPSRQPPSGAPSISKAPIRPPAITSPIT
jgi:hypothetical protein